MLGPQAGHGDAMPLQPGGRLVVERLEAAASPRSASARPARKPQATISEAKATKTSDDEAHDDRQRQKLRQTRCSLCSGQTMAMMKSAKATGAKTELATDSAATTRMVAITPIIARIQ